jgi:hypothetical protein
MSVTFFPEAIKYEQVPYSCFCVDNDGVPDVDCWDCEGTGTVYFDEPAEEFFTCNFSNTNARNILQVAMPEIYYEDLCGSWDSALQDRATKNLLNTLNKENNPLFRESFEEGNFIHCGVGLRAASLEAAKPLTQAERQITLLLKVLQCCKKHNCNLNFA